MSEDLAPAAGILTGVSLGLLAWALVAACAILVVHLPY